MIKIKKEYSYGILAIVAIVAIVAIFNLSSSEITTTTEISLEKENLVGEAINKFNKKTKTPSITTANDTGGEGDSGICAVCGLDFLGGNFNPGNDLCCCIGQCGFSECDNYDCLGGGGGNTCIDDDGGLEYYIASSTSWQDGGLGCIDSCWNDNIVSECYCITESGATTQQYSCPNGCSNGACI